MAAQAETKTETNVTRLPSKGRRTAKKTAKRATSTARKTARATSKTAKKTVRTAASAATKTIDTATRAATAKSPSDALNSWTSMFQQSPFKLESFMNTNQQPFGQSFGQSFPQFEDFQKQFSQFTPQLGQFGNFQNQFQSKANDANDFAAKATQAAEKSRNRLAAGVEECSKTIASMAQSNMQRSNEAMRTLMACKSLNELADVQTRLFKQNFEALSAETSRLVDQITRTVTSASEPMSDLANTALSQAKKAAQA